MFGIANASLTSALRIGFILQTHNSIAEKSPSNLSFKVLQCGVKLAVYQTNKTSKAAISVSINKGHFYSQAYPEGFAHLLEHMLFNASSRYQQTNALDSHLQQFHGQTNGWTQDLFTNYQLNCDPQGFIKACDILIDRLCRPCFHINEIEKEISAIDAEFKLQKKDPVQKLRSVHKVTCNPAHPFSKFSTGNLQTLTKLNIQDTQSLLFEFHLAIMQGKNVCISLGVPNTQINNADIEHLPEIIEQGFAVLNKKRLQATSKVSSEFFKRKPASTMVPFYNKKQVATFIQIKDQKQQHQLMVSYAIEHVNMHVADSLFVLLTHLIASKHQNSLHDLLIKKGLINDLFSNYKHLDKQNSELMISVNLSSEGAKQTQFIAQAIMAFITFLQANGIEKWRFREKAAQFELQANLQGEPGLLEQTISLSEKMHDVPFAQCMQAEQFSIDEAFELLPSMLQQLTLAKARIYFISPFAITDKVSEHYDVNYSIEAFKPNNDDTRHYYFEKPRQNPFLGGENKMVFDELSPTTLFALKSEQVNLKFFQDTSFNLPYGECYISITDENMHATARQIAIKRVWLACLNEHLAIRFFDVEMASLHFRVYPHHHGVSIHTSGLSERQLLLCIELINVIKAYKASDCAIKRHLNHCTSRMQNNLQQKPFNQLFSWLNEYYLPKERNAANILDCLSKLSVEDIQQCQQQYFVHNYVESLTIGNWQTSAIKRLFGQLNSRFNALETVVKPKASLKCVETGEHWHFHTPKLAEQNIIWHFVPKFDLKPSTIALAARSLVLEKLLAPLSFEILRKKHAMGYMLGVGYKPVGGFPGIAMYMLSPTHSLSQIMSAMHEVIDLGINTLNNEPDILAHMVKDLNKQVAPKERDIGQRATRAWLHFEDINPLLAYEDLIKALNALSLQEIISCLHCMRDTSKGQLLLSQDALPLGKNISDNGCNSVGEYEKRFKPALFAKFKCKMP